MNERGGELLRGEGVLCGLMRVENETTQVHVYGTDPGKAGTISNRERDDSGSQEVPCFLSLADLAWNLQVPRMPLVERGSPGVRLHAD